MSDFILLRRGETVRNGRIARRRNGLLLPAICLGAGIAWWLAWNVLPGVTIYTNEDGQWEQIDVNWETSLLKNHQEHFPR